MADNEKKTFQDYFAEGMENLATTAFPQLSKFMDFSREKKKDEDKTSDSITEQEDEDEKPRRRNKRASAYAVANEMVLDALGAIDERLKIQSIVLVSSLEQQTQTNQLLSRLVAGEGGGGLFGGGGSGVGGGVLRDIADIAGGAAVVNWMKNFGKRILGGAGGIAGDIAVAGGTAAAGAGSLIFGDISGNEEMKRKHPGFYPVDPNSISPEEKQAIIGDLQKGVNEQKTKDIDHQISNYQDNLDHINHHLKLNDETEAERKKLLDEEVFIQKQINDLQQQKADLLKKEKDATSPAVPNVGLDGNPAIKPTQNVDPLGSSVTVAQDGGANITLPTFDVPIPNGGATAPGIPIGKGVTAADIARRGGIGRSVGGGSPGGSHPAGTGGYRSTGGGAGSAANPQNQAEAWQFFKSKGYTDEETAQIMGNLQQESQFNPNANNPNDAGPGRPSQGIAQWNDGKASHPSNRRTDMMNFVSQKYGSPYDQLTAQEKYTGQLGFIDHELHGNYKGAYDLLKRGDYKSFGHAYEGYGSPPDQGGENTRYANGQAILARGRAGQFDHKPSQASPKNTAPSDVPVAKPGDFNESEITDISKESTYPRQNEKINDVKGFIWHHTGSGKMTPDSVVGTLNQRGLGVQYVMDRNGKIFRTLPDGSRGAHILPSEINDLSNSNSEGMEVIANDDKDVTPAQVASGKRFSDYLRRRYPGIQEFGHGEVNPSHKQATEGHTIVAAIREAMHAQAPSLTPTKDSAASTVPLEKRTLMGYATGNIDAGPNKKPAADKDESVSNMFVKKSNEDAIFDRMESKKPAIIQQFNNHKTDTAADGKEKSERLSGKSVGSPIAPAPRLKELFTAPETGKSF